VKSDLERHRAWSVKLPNFDGVNYSLGLYGLMKARNLQDFKAALSRQLMPRWNLLYSDAENIYWVHNGNVAARAQGYDWRKPVPGWLKETEWGPYIPFNLHPQLLNPPSGFLQNCNDPFWVATRASGLDPLAPAPYYLQNPPAVDQPQPRTALPERTVEQYLLAAKPIAGEEALNTRGERVFQVLTQDRKFTLDEMKELGLDTYLLPADVIVPLLDRAYKRKPEPRLARALDLIRAWDHRSATDSAAFTYIYFWAKAYIDLFSGSRFSRFISYSRRKIDVDSAEEQDMALRALHEALDRIQKRFGRSEVPWGDVNVVVRGGVFPMDGTDLFGVLHPDEGVEQEDGRIHSNDGWGHLMVVMEGEPKQIWSLLPYGQSEDPNSPHYNDQARLHSRRQLKRFWFTPEEILRHTTRVWGNRDRLRKLLPSRARQQAVSEPAPPARCY